MVFEKLFKLLFIIYYFMDSISTKEAQHDFRYISYRDLLPSVQKFNHSGITSYSQMLFVVAKHQILVGAKDILFRLSLDGLRIIEYSQWSPPSIKQSECVAKGQSEENCHNFIKVLLTNGTHIFACGTHAFSPQCSWRDIDKISEVIESVDGIGKCPYNPSANITAFIDENNEFYFGGPANLVGSDSLIAKSIGKHKHVRTKHSDGFWLNEPQFVGTFESDHHVYFLFRETAVEYINCGKIIYSRIARICKNDSGGNVTRDNWSTFIKARLNCSISGEYPFYFNEIQSMTHLPDENIIYATFTTGSNSIVGSAVCAFNLSAINDAFAGPFKFRPSSGSTWNKHENSYKDHFECRSSSMNSYLEMEVSKYQLMDSAVKATTLNPLHVGELERFSHITIDVLSTKLQNNLHVIYVATLEGLIKKLIIPHDHKEACVVEIWQTQSDNFLLIKNMQFLKVTKSIYITTNKELIQIPANHCKRHISKENCLSAMDPYCGWDEREEACTPPPGDNPNSRIWQQSVTSCPVLNIPIHGGWSSWSDWEPCLHRIGSDLSDKCLCQKRHCNNPAPSNNGRTCVGPSITVTNCTVHGGWSSWSEWSPCSATCGQAVKTSRRTCTNPTPAFGGRVCVGQDKNETMCYGPPCPVNGDWGGWSEWSPCTHTCGFKTRNRLCNNPKPKANGHYCVGNDIEYSKCDSEECSYDRKAVTHTTEWVSLNNSKKKRFKLTCKAPVLSQNQIKIYVKEETHVCHSNGCFEDSPHSYGLWGGWSNCSAKCGGGIQERYRSCRTNKCSGPPIETRACNKHPCENGWTCWTDWSACNISCGWGFQTRTRTCLGQHCQGSNIEEKPCQRQPCEDLLDWGNWTDWSVCDSNYMQHRKRKCSQLGNNTCQGDSVQTRPCGSLQQSCMLTNGVFLIIGLLCGFAPGLIYLIYTTIRKKKNIIPSSPHYITEQNPYISVPTKDRNPKKTSPNSSNFNINNGTLKSNKTYFDDLEITTLKKNNQDHRRRDNSDNYLYD